MTTVSLGPTSTLATKVIRGTNRDLNLDDLKFYGMPRFDLPEVMSDWKSDNLPNFMRGFNQVKVALENNIPHFYGRLWVKHISADGLITDYGLVSLRVVTTAGVAYIANCFAGTATYEPEKMRYHGIGIGTTAESTGNTNLVTAITGDDLNPQGTRATGSLEVPSANVFRTVGTNTLAGGVSTKVVTEHGIFDTATITSGGTLLDRTVFASISLNAGDSLQTTYDLTFTAGS